MSWGTWRGQKIYCPLCGLYGYKVRLVVQVDVYAFRCKNGHIFSIRDMAEFTTRHEELA